MQAQRTFLIRVAAFFLLPLFAYVVCPREIYQTTEFSIWKSVFERAGGKRAYRNVVIGDSRAQYGIDAHELNAENLALGGTSPVEGYYLLKEIFRSQRPDTVYLSWSAAHFYSQDCFFQRGVFYGWIPEAYLNQVMRQSAERHDPIFTPEWLFRTDHSPMSGMWEAGFPIRLCIRIQDLYEAARFGPYNAIKHLLRPSGAESQLSAGYNTWNENDMISDSSNDNETLEWILWKEHPVMEMSAMNVDYQDSLIQLCDDHHSVVYFIRIPIPEHCVDPGEEYLNRYEELLKIKFGNRLLSDKLRYPNALFRDSSHLNKHGVKKLTSEILRQKGMTHTMAK